MDRFKFRIPFYDNENNFLGFKYIEVLEGLGAYNYGTCHHGDPEQCTDLKDKNGNLIYEGDICIPAKDMADKAGEVYRAESGAYFIKGRMKSGMEYDFGIYWHHYMYEVIGNIHENPELLEDK